MAFLKLQSKNGPLSLTCLSAKLAPAFLVNHPTENLTWFVREHPIAVQHEVSLHLCGKDLVQFIRLHTNLFCLKSKFYDSQFQTFILHLLGELEKKEISCKEKNFLKRELEFLSMSLYCDLKTHFDWCTQSLGIDFIFRQDFTEGSLEKSFFRSKFSFNQKTYGPKKRLPYPEVDTGHNISTLIPLFDSTARYAALVSPKLAREDEPPIPPTANDLFFSKLLALSLCEKKGADHEALAYAVDLLSTKLYLKQRSTSRCLFHVWGLVAVSLSKLQFSPCLVEACMANVDDAVEFPSEELDAIFYRQKVAVHFDNCLEEKFLFDQIYKSMPRNSFFWQISLSIHLEFVLKTLENGLLECILLNRVIDLSNFPSVRRQKLKDERKNIISKAKIEISRSQKLIYNYLADPPENEKIEKMLSLLETFNLFLFAFEHTQNSFSSLYRLEAIKYKIGNAYHFLQHAIDWKCNMQSDVADYRNSMLLEQCEIEEASHSRGPILWGDVTFSHFVILSILLPNSGEDNLRMEQSLEIYRKFNHPRADMIRQFKKARVNRPYCSFADLKKKQFKKTDSIKMFNWNVFALLKSDIDLRHLVRAGLDSVRHHDV